MKVLTRRDFLKTAVLGGTGLAMSIAMAGCGSSSSSTSSSSSADSDSSAAETSEETVKIVLETLYYDAQPADLEAVEEAINELTIPAINVEVELYPMAFSDASTNVSLMISGGQQLDLVVCANRSDFLSLVNKGMVLELDDLYAEYGTAIEENAGDVVPGGYVGTTLYGIPSIEKYGREYGLIVRTDVTDEIGWSQFEDVTLDDMTDFLSQAQEAFPELDMIQVAGGGNNITLFDYFHKLDYLGADAACGGIMGIGADTDDTIVNTFATDEYYEFCKTMREWFQAGYFNSDCATSTDMGSTAVTAGTAAGYFLNSELDMVATQAAANGYDMVALTTRDHNLVQGDINNQTWSITMNCENPEAAMKLMNMMWESEDLINLLYYGIEGLDYQYMDDGSGRITYVDGQNAQTCGFHQWFGLYGDTTQRLTWDSLDADYHDQLVAYNAEVDENNTSKYLGYNFNPDDVKTEYSAVTDVITTYRTALECGSVDPDEVLPKFLEALESAGINDIIEANQAALDEWLAEQ